MALPAVQSANAGDYTVIVSNAAGSVTSAVAVLAVNIAPVINAQPQSQTVAAGADVTFSVEAGGTGPLSYQWQFNGASIPDATGPTLALPAVQSANAGDYTVVVSNTVGSLTSAVAVLTVNLPPVINAPPQGQTVAAGADVTFNVEADGTEPLSYQWLFNGASISNATGPAFALPAVQSANAGDYIVVVSNAAGSVTSPVAVLTVNIPPVINAQPQSQTVVAGADVTFNVEAAGTGPLSYQWQFNGGTISDATGPALALPAVQSANAGDYTVVVSNASGSVTSSVAVLTVNIAPVIAAQPQSQTVVAGADVTLNVEAGGTGPLSYQWQFNGATIPDATGPALVLAAVQSANAGDYTVVVSNASGSVTSSVAVLTVNIPPVINAPPQSQTVSVGADVTFHVEAGGTGPLSYQWQFNGANTPDATGPTFALPAVQSANAGDYTVVVSNASGSVTSAAATLLVKSVTVPRLESIGLADGEFRFTVLAPSGLQFIVEVSKDISNWLPVSTNKVTDGGFLFSDKETTRFSERFYRVRLLP